MSRDPWNATLDTDAGSIGVRRLSGREAIGRPYHFDLALEADDPDLDGGAIMRGPATLRIFAGGRERRIHGVVRTFEQGDAVESRYAYRAVLVPRVALLDLGQESRIYQHLTVPEIVVSVLAAGGIDIAEVDLRLEREHPRRRYVVQYQESPLAFVSRLLEDEGIGMSFGHDGARERLVLCDENTGYPVVDALSYRGEATSGTRLESLRIVRKSLPARVFVSDYDARAPHVPLQAEATVDPHGVGLYCDAATHFDDPRHGQALAQLRAEELRARATTVEVTSEAPLASGICAPLRGHFRAEVNQPLLLTEVDHEAGPSGYTARCSALFADVPHRPERRTPKPRLHGVMNAHVDASGPGASAAVDDEGRYRVVMPFDLSGAEEGRATAPMRFAQPYGGPDQGLHFAIPKGAEVVWTCLDGDPDRPVITGTVPNAESPSLVTRSNAESTILRGRGGATLELRGPAPRPRLAAQQLHASSDPDDANIDSIQADSGVTAAESAVFTSLEQQQDALQAKTSSLASQSGGSSRDTWFKIHVPHSATIGSHSDPRAISYVRYGEEPHSDEEPPQHDQARKSWLEENLSLNKPDPATHAFVDAANIGDYQIAELQTLEVKIDGGTKHTVIFPAHGGGKWPPQEVATAIDDSFAAANPVVLGHATVVDGKVRLSARSYGSSSKVEVVGGTANDVLGFPPGQHAGSDGAAYSDAPDVDSKEEWRTSGVFDYTDRNRTVVTRGNVEELVQGEKTVTIMSADPVYKAHSKTFYADGGEGWRVLSAKHGAFTDLTGGYKEFFTTGFCYTGTVGASTSATLAAKADFNISATVAATMGFKADFFWGGAYSFKKDYAVEYANTFTKKAAKTITLEVGAGDFEATTKPQIITAIAASAAAVAGGLAGSAVSLASILDENEPTAHIGSSVAAGSATLAAIALTVVAAVDYAKTKAAAKSLSGSTSKVKLELSEKAILLDGAPIDPSANSLYAAINAPKKFIVLSIDDETFIQLEDGAVRIKAKKISMEGNLEVHGSLSDATGTKLQLQSPPVAIQNVVKKPKVKQD